MATDRLQLDQPAKHTRDWHSLLNTNFDRIDNKLARTHAGNPNGEITPDFAGQVVWDTENNRRYVARGTSTNQWMIDGFDPGTKAIFYQASAPSGWVQDTEENDRMLRLVDSQGGGTGGQWEISGITVHKHSLTINEIPSHDHGGGNHGHNFDLTSDNDGSVNNSTRNWLTGEVQSGLDTNDLRSGGSMNNRGRVRDSVRNSGSIINLQGGDAGHGHDASQNGNWRPRYVDVIAAIKEA